MTMSPSAPGTYVTIGAAAPSPSLGSQTGTWFVTGEAEEGPTGVAIPLTSMTDYANYLGSRAGYTQLYDALDEFFHDGGTFAYVSRVVGASPTAASVVLADQADSAQNTLTISALGAGVWGNSVSVVVATGSEADTYTIGLTDATTGRSWTSPDLSTPADAVTWATNLTGSGTSPWVFPFTITNDGSTTDAPDNNPANVSTVLSGGADDLSGVTEAQWTDALTAFGSNLGPGQVSAPGHNTESGWQALVAHASAVDSVGMLVNNRFALLDDVDSATASDVVSEVSDVQAGSGDPSFGMLLAPWVVVPGIPATSSSASLAATTRTVPPSALVAALMARNDASNNAGVPAAGQNGESNFALGVTQTYDEADRGTLNSGQVSVIRQFSSGVELYGYVTCAVNPSWVSASFARMRMELVDALKTAARPFAFRQIDGKGQLLAQYNGSLAGVCQDYWQEGALYGATAGDAFQVNTGPSVNTPTTLAAGQLNAVVSVRFSPFAQFVDISVVEFAITSSLPA